MGSMLEINDTLQITTAEGFPETIFNLERHRARPITLDEVQDLRFEFSHKAGPRFFHLDPVRVYWYHNIGGRWLAWGQILIQSQSITRNPDAAGHQGAVNVSDPAQWMTGGTYRILKVYDPAYQEAFTRHDLPSSLSFFNGP